MLQVLTNSASPILLLLPLLVHNLLLHGSATEAFSSLPLRSTPRSTNPRSVVVWIYAPPGSGYARPQDEESSLPNTYQPMMEFPGTMRPGRTPENMPYQDLPLADDDPDPVPWPHFQQIEWHHRWDPPHPHPIPMEDYIDQQGRWATPELEARMRAGVRRDVRERQEKEAAAAGADFVITDDDDDDDTVGSDEPIALGEGMFGSIGSAVDFALTADATRARTDQDDDDEEEDEGSEDDDLDSFLLDLGLDADVDDMIGDDLPTVKTGPILLGEDDDDDIPLMDILGGDEGDIISSIGELEDMDDLDGVGMNDFKFGLDELGLDEDDEGGIGGDGDDGLSTVPLDDFDSDLDSLEGEDIFDEGGFDFEGGDFDDGDVW